jgi:hypothetical protein
MEITTSINMDSYGLNSHNMANVVHTGVMYLCFSNTPNTTSQVAPWNIYALNETFRFWIKCTDT